MDTSGNELEPVDRLADEFLERQRRGEQPTLDEYVRRYPDLAEEIRDVFPALLLMQQIEPAESDLEPSRTIPTPDEIRDKQIADYRLLREVGRGGMGVVYEAEQQSLGRRVALKVLPREISGNDRSMARFQREARAAARLHHTNIVPVFEVGQDGETAFYAMQLIQGQGLDVVIGDLKRLRSEHASRGKSAATGIKHSEHGIAASLASGRFEQDKLASDSEWSNVEREPAHTETVEHSPDSTAPAALPGPTEMSTAETNRSSFHEAVARIGVQAADALAYAHARGIIHRDIKPSNLILDMSGVVWVTDFGLAKTDDEAMTHTGDILGTMRYMSPERFRGECDVRADLYSLGLTLYEILVLSPAFQSPDRLKLIEMIRESEPPRPRSIDPRISRDLETIVLKSIDKDPRRRYQSADELSEDLQRFIGDEPIKARRVWVFERFAHWCRRNKGLAASLLVLAALVLITTVGSTLAAGYFQNLAVKTAGLAREKEASLSREVDQRKKTETALYHALWGEANALRMARKPGYKSQVWSRLKQALAINTPAKDVDQLRQEAAACLGDFVGAEPIVWKQPEEIGGTLAVFPNGRKLALGLSDFSITIRTIETNQEQARLQTSFSELISDICISPDGNHLVTCDKHGCTEHWTSGADGRWKRLDPHTEPEPEAEAGSSGLTMAAVRFFPDGRRYTVSRFRGKTVHIRGVTHRKLDMSLPIPEGGGHVGVPGISPDSRLLAVPFWSGEADEIGIWNTETGNLERRIQTSLHGLYETAFTPDGKFLVCGADDGFATYETQSFQQWSLIRLDSVSSLTFTPDSRVLAFATLSQKIRLWDLTAHREIAVIDLDRDAWSLSLVTSGDGHRLFSAGNSEVRIWRLRGLPEKQVLAGHNEMVPCNAFSPDGKLLATGSKDKTVRLWDARTGTLLHSISLKEVVQSVAFSRDGRLLAICPWGAELAVWNLESRQRVAAPRLGRGFADCLAFTSDGSTLVASGDGLTVFEVANSYPENPDGRVTELNEKDSLDGSRSLFLAISPDDKTVAWVDRNVRLRIWDLEHRREKPFPNEPLLMLGFHNVSFLPDCRHVIFIARNGKPQVWDTQTGKLAYEIADTPRFQSFTNALSPDGRWLAGDATAEALTIVDIRAKKQLFTLGSERSPIKSVCWSPDGKRAALGLSDGGVVIWNLESVREQLTDIGLGWN